MLMIICYIILVIGSYYLIKDVYLEETELKDVSYNERIFILLLSLLIFVSMFLVMGYYTLKNTNNESKSKQ